MKKLLALSLIPTLFLINAGSARAFDLGDLGIDFDLESITGDIENEVGSVIGEVSGIDLPENLDLGDIEGQIGDLIAKAESEGKEELAGLLQERLSGLGVLGNILNGDIDIEKIAQDLLGIDGYIDIVKLASDPEYRKEILSELVGTDRISSAMTQVVISEKIAKDTDKAVFDRRTEEELYISQLGDHFGSMEGTNMGEPGESTYDVVTQALNETRQNISVANAIGGEQLKALGTIAERQKAQLDAFNTSNQLSLQQVEEISRERKKQEAIEASLEERNNRTSFGMAGFYQKLEEK